MSQTATGRLVEQLSRNEGRKLTGALLRVLGGGRLAFAEDCVQDAFAAALESWPEKGVPRDPFAWVLAAARNRALDRLRHSAMTAAVEPRLIQWIQGLSASEHDNLGDEELTLLVLCCNPALEAEAQLALMLKSVCGFSVPEIARAFLIKPETVAQRLVRAKARIRDLNLAFELPSGPDLGLRMPAVLKAVYLLFNEGYAPSDGDTALKGDVCHEALRLIRLITQNAGTESGEADALRALIAFQHSRWQARQAPDGALVLLEDQDRSLWSQDLIAEGFAALQRSMRSDRLTPTHIEAGIASLHAAARSAALTNWAQIASYYDHLMEIAPSPVAALNRAVALSMRDGPEAGLAALQSWAGAPQLQRYAPFHVAHGHLLIRAGRESEARMALEAVLALPLSGPERRLAEHRLREIPSAAR